MAEPINHDTASTVATGGLKVAKWGLIGLVASALIPALVVGGPLLLIGSALGAGVAGSIVGGLGIVAGIAAGVAGAAVGWLPSMGIGALFGVSQASKQVGAETAAYNSRAQGHAQNHAFKTAEMGHKKELQGIQSGYAFGRKDGELVGYAKGERDGAVKMRNYLVSQGLVNIPPEAPANKPPITIGGKTIVSASCDCKAEAIIADREAQAVSSATGEIKRG